MPALLAILIAVLAVITVGAPIAFGLVAERRSHPRTPRTPDPASRS